MPATEPIQGGPYPEPSDPPDGPNQMSALAVWAAGRLVMRFATPAARDAAIISPVAAMRAVTGTGATQVDWIYSGTEWIRVWAPGAVPYATAAGAVVVVGAGTADATAAITFPAGRFSVAPLVVCDGVTSTTQALVASALSISTSGATVRLRIVTAATFNSNYGVTWQAVQMTAASAAG